LKRFNEKLMQFGHPCSILSCGQAGIEFPREDNSACREYEGWEAYEQPRNPFTPLVVGHQLDVSTFYPRLVAS
jgi:hypothetical protein